MDLEDMSKRELIELIKGLMKELRHIKKELGYEKSEKLSEMFKPAVPKDEAPQKPGAKEGHEGVTRPMPEKTDEKKKLFLRTCPQGHRLAKIKETRSRTVEDIELVRRLKIIEYELQGYYCKTCKKKVFPRIFDAMPRFRLGMNFCNYVCERKLGYRMSFNMIQKDLLKNFGLKVSQATLVNAIHAVAGLLGKKYEEYKRLLREGNFVHIDETGWRVEGTNMWLWKFRSKDIVVTVIDKHRSHGVPESILGKEYKGVMIHDGFPAYNLLDGEHQQCWTHITRHSRNACKKYPDSKEVKKVHEALKRMYRDATQTRKSKAARKRFDARMKRLLAKRYRNPEIVKLKRFLKAHLDELFVFAAKRIEGTNNAAEQSIRHDVVIRKISGGNRSEKGKEDYAVLSSAMQTCQLRNEDFSELVMNELQSTANG
jgi:transposase